MEYLMTYGWAILVIIIVIAVLFYIGVLNPRNVTPTSCTFPPGISCASFKLNTSNVLALRLGQALGHRINITGINCTTALERPEGFFTDGNTSLPSNPIRNAESANLTTMCVSDTGEDLAPGSTGDTIKLKIWLRYEEIDPGTPIVERVIPGDLAARYE